MPLAPKVVETLLVLVSRAGEVVTKEELLQRVWPDAQVVESGLTRNISILRKCLDSEPATRQAIQTLPRRGYVFGAPVVREAPDAEESEKAATERRPRVRVAAGALLAVVVGAGALTTAAYRWFGSSQDDVRPATLRNGPRSRQ